MSAKRNLNLIQALRGVASLLVVLFHTTMLLKEKSNENFLGGFFAFGGAGVDIFFVLSGFIITYSSKNLVIKSSTFLLFLKRRFVRIFPVYWIIVSGLLLLQFALPTFYNSHYDINFANLIATYFLFPQHIMLNGVSWTLSYELFFYLLFALVFLIKRKNVLIALSLIYLILIIILPSLGYYFKDKWLDLIFFPMNIEFFMGIFIALFITKLPSKFSAPFIIGGTILFLLSALVNNEGVSIASGAFNRVLLFGVPSFFIIAGVVKLELVKSIKTHNVFIVLGEASYSLYLIHLPIIAAFLKIGNRYLGQSSSMLFLGAVLAIIMVCVASIYFYKFVEKPMIKKINNIIN